ncbi:aldehyde dehydrogenase (NADP(+)) [Winogradskyella immobilis]|uniref:Aldehyde dehydrogenase (NADP(+)) n=1 Tax=Winogradskyella immobilis TaxID=2816852 RepID=A0ABS8EIV3_9FLAO|nr:aldehyde dehydrogenase (NADP(+)) [Winogradskyella immobilis]MCC1483088.1 aldehyde dehydrogenase (NADP(+)) [Winogradskyella immobilis]MCG0015183.1 aldehyde dehydrogenase (NADP(+)) [Winogradskyella immobilis]
MITGKNYIGNQLIAEGNKTYKTFNPQLNIENTTVFTEATLNEIDQAVQLASKAFKTYRDISGQKKAEFLNAIADEIEALGDELIETYRSESGLPEGRAKGERGRTIGQLRAFAAHISEGSWVEASIDKAQPERQPLPKVDLRKMLIPLGPIVVFGASNFPLAFSTAGGDTVAALAAGCPVIVKSHPMHAGTGELVASAVVKAAQKTEMPNGVFSNINSSGIEVGQQLVKHPQIKGVGFTGSIRGGRALFDIAAQRKEPIPVFAEMGSINPVVLLPEALKEKGKDWAKTYAGSITLGSGQFCTNPGLIIGLKGEDLDVFTSELAEEISKIKPTCMLHPNISNAYQSNKAKVLQQPELNVLAEYGDEVQSNFAQQVVLKVKGSTFLENKTLHQEVFGPFSIIVECEDDEELEDILNQLEGQLTGTIIGNNTDITSNKKIVSALQNRVGRIIFNGVPTGVEVCPSMQHGGPYPASTDSRFTAVGVDSIKRWVRPFTFQNWPNSILPDALKNENPLEILRLVDNVKTRVKL